MDRKTILLVEDDHLLKRLIKGVLERQYRVLEAESCIEAIKQIGGSVDIALVDYILPDGDGLHVLKVIREMKPQLPVVIMTAYSTDNLAI